LQTTRRARKTRGREKRTRENKKSSKKPPPQLLRTQYSEDKSRSDTPGLEFWKPFLAALGVF
jgi:hypothetical protein